MPEWRLHVNELRGRLKADVGDTKWRMALGNTVEI